MTRPWRRFTETEDNAIRAGRKAGMTYAAIAADIGRAKHSVGVRARILGLVVQRVPDTALLAPRACLFHGGLFRPRHRLEFTCVACQESDEWQRKAALP